jgi:hypothetical protein
MYVKDTSEGYMRQHVGGTEVWYNWHNEKGQLHRVDGPAVVINGTEIWYKEGERHREGGLPSGEFANGSKEWFVEGKRHRDGDLPAIVRRNGTMFWYKYGRRHRIGGQTVVVTGSVVPLSKITTIYRRSVVFVCRCSVRRSRLRT